MPENFNFAQLPPQVAPYMQHPQSQPPSMPVANGGFGRGMAQPIMDYRNALMAWIDQRPTHPMGGFADQAARQTFQQGMMDWRQARPSFNGLNALNVAPTQPVQGIAAGEPNPGTPVGYQRPF